MISYNPRHWALFLFRLHKTDTVRKLFPLIAFIGFYAAGIAWLELHYLDGEGGRLKNITALHTLLGFAISILVVFRTNTAYDRWWEGRKLWGGLVNNSRNLAIKLDALLPGDDQRNRRFFAQLIPAFAFELRNHLQSEITRLSLDEQPHPEIPDFDRAKHVPNQVASLLIARIFQLQREGKITGEQMILINGELSSFTDTCGACERIKNTPIPYSYSAFIKKFIFFYVITLPIGYVFTMGYWVVPLSIFILYVLASLELIAEEIEDPFGKDTNDLPMDKMAATISRNVNEILGNRNAERAA